MSTAPASQTPTPEPPPIVWDQAQLLATPVSAWPQPNLEEILQTVTPEQAMVMAQFARQSNTLFHARLQALCSEFDQFRQEQQNAFFQVMAQAPGAAQTPAAPKAKFPEPMEFSGNRSSFEAFQSQVKAYLTVNGHAYPTDQMKSLYTLQKIRGAAYNHVQAWVDSATTDKPAEEITDWNKCLASLQKVFGPINESEDAINTLRSLRHTSTVDVYASEYRRLGPKTKYGDAPLCTMFESGLKHEIRDRFVGRDKPKTLEDWIREAAGIERDLSQLRSKPWGRNPNQFTAPRAQHHDPNAMEVDQISTSERERRRTLGLCYYCGQAGHIAPRCPVKPAGSRRSNPRVAATTGSASTPVAASSPGNAAPASATPAADSVGSPPAAQASLAAAPASATLAAPSPTTPALIAQLETLNRYLAAGSARNSEGSSGADF